MNIGKFFHRQKGPFNKYSSQSPKGRNAKTPKFYMLSKILKENYPGRPIIAAIDSLTSKLPTFVDHHPQPIAEQLLSFIKDTGVFLRKIEKTKKGPKNSILLTMDVAALYTNIPHV